MKLLIKNKLIQLLGNEQYNNIIHTKNYFSATAVTQGLNFILIPIKTRLLTPSDYGILAIVNSIVQVLGIFFDTGTYGAVNRYYHEQKNDFYIFIKNALLFTFILDILWIIIIFIFRNQLSLFLKISPKLIVFASFIAFVNIPFLIYMAYLNAKANSVLYSRLSIIKFLLISIPSIIWMFLLKDNRYMGVLYPMLITGAIFALYCYYKVFYIIKEKYLFVFTHIIYILKFGIPLIPHALSGIILAYFDRIIINQLSGNNEAGLYSFAYNVGLLIYMFVIAFVKTWNPFLYKNMNSKSFNLINKTAINNIRMLFFISFILIMFLKEIIIILAPPSYYEALKIIPIIIFSYNWVFLYMLCVGFAFYAKKTYLISIFTLIASIVNIILNYWLIPVFGYYAAAYTTLFSYILLFVLHYLNIKFILKYNILKFAIIFRDMFFALILYFSIHYIVNNINIIFSIIIKIGIIILIILFIIKRKKINK